MLSPTPPQHTRRAHFTFVQLTSEHHLVVLRAVATGWQAVTPLEEASNKMLPAASGGGMPEISEQ